MPNQVDSTPKKKKRKYKIKALKSMDAQIVLIMGFDYKRI